MLSHELGQPRGRRVGDGERAYCQWEHIHAIAEGVVLQLITPAPGARGRTTAPRVAATRSRSQTNGVEIVELELLAAAGMLVAVLVVFAEIDALAPAPASTTWSVVGPGDCTGKADG